MKNKLICSIVLMSCLFKGIVFAENSGAAFLLDDTDAKSFSMGSAFTAVCDNPNSIIINPAGLAFYSISEMSLDYKKNILDAYNSSAFCVLPIRKIGTLGLGAALYDSGSVDINYLDGTSETVRAMQSWVFNFGFGFNLSDEIATGVNIKYINSTLAGKFTGTAFAADIGGLFRTVDDFFTFGLAIQNVGTKLTYVSTGDPLPFTIRAGLGFNIRDTNIDSWLVSADVLYFNSKTRYNFGVECDVFNTLSIRAGYKLGYAPDVLTLGFGLNVLGVRIDYAYSMLGGLDNMQMFTMSYGFEIASEYSKAIDYYERGMRDKSYYIFSRVSKKDINYAGAKRYIEKINKETDTELRIIKWIKEGNELYSKEEYDESFQRYTELLAIDPNNTTAKNMLQNSNKGKQGSVILEQGVKHQEDNIFERAIDDYVTCISYFTKTSKNIAKAKYLIAVCYQKLQNYNKAIEYYDEVIMNYPNTEWCEKAINEKKSLGVIKRLDKKTTDGNADKQEDYFIKY